MEAPAPGSMILAADVKQAVSVPDLLQFYGIQIDRHGRCACPIHGGRDRNMMVKRDFYHCFVCGAVGTVIDLQMAISDRTFAQAISDINTIFGLGLDSSDPEAQHAARYRIAMMRAEAAEREAINRWNIAQIDFITEIRRELVYYTDHDCGELDKLLDECEAVSRDGEVRLPSATEMLVKKGVRVRKTK